MISEENVFQTEQSDVQNEPRRPSYTRKYTVIKTPTTDRVVKELTAGELYKRTRGNCAKPDSDCRHGNRHGQVDQSLHVGEQENSLCDQTVKDTADWVKRGVKSKEVFEDKLNGNQRLTSSVTTKGTCDDCHRGYINICHNNKSCGSEGTRTNPSSVESLPALYIPQYCYKWNKTAKRATAWKKEEKKNLYSSAIIEECKKPNTVIENTSSVPSHSSDSSRFKHSYKDLKATRTEISAEPKSEGSLEYESKPKASNKPSSPLIRLKHFLSSKRRNRNLDAVSVGLPLTSTKKQYQPLNSNGVCPGCKPKKASRKILKKRHHRLITDCYSKSRSSKESLPSLLGTDCCDSVCDNNNCSPTFDDGVYSFGSYVRRDTEGLVNSSDSDCSPVSLHDQTPSAQANRLAAYGIPDHTIAIESSSSESHPFYRDGSSDLLTSDVGQSPKRRCCNCHQITASETFYSCVSELELDNGCNLGRSDSFPDFKGVDIRYCSRDTPEAFQNHCAFSNSSSCDKLVSIPFSDGIPSVLEAQIHTAVGESTANDCLQKEFRDHLEKKSNLDNNCSEDSNKLSQLTQGIQCINLDHLTLTCDCSDKYQHQKAIGLRTSIVSSTEPCGLNPFSSATQRQDIVDVISDDALIVDSNTKVPLLSQEQPACNQCDQLKQRLELTRRTLEKPLKALKSFLEDLVQKIYRSGTLCTGSPSWYNSSEVRGPGLVNTTTTATTAEEVQKEVDEEFDHSAQCLEYQFDNGIWTDSRSSLKALYDYEVRSLCFEEEEDLDCDTIVATMQDEERATEGGAQVLDTGQTTAEHRQKCAGSRVNRKESVREWLQSIGNGSESLGEQDKLPAEAESEPKQDHNANFEDDLFLGAEAKLINTSGKQGGEKEFENDGNKENLPEESPKEEPSASQKQARGKLCRTKTVDYPATPPRGQGHVRRFSLQHRFPFIHTDSLQSNDSAKTYSSVNEILQERTGNPFQILSNLGFGSSDQGDELSERIPLRFLTTQSNAEGIEVEDFLGKHPQLKEQVLRQDVIGQPFGGVHNPVSQSNSSESSGKVIGGDCVDDHVTQGIDVPRRRYVKKMSLFEARSEFKKLRAPPAFLDSFLASVGLMGEAGQGRDENKGDNKRIITGEKGENGDRKGDELGGASKGSKEEVSGAGNNSGSKEIKVKAITPLKENGTVKDIEEELVTIVTEVAGMSDKCRHDNDKNTSCEMIDVPLVPPPRRKREVTSKNAKDVTLKKKVKVASSPVALQECIPEKPARRKRNVVIGRLDLEPPTQPPLPPQPSRRNSLFNVARNVILLNRFSASLPQTKSTNTDQQPQVALHEGVTSKGTVYQSILHPDNTEFFAKQGLYDDTSSADKSLVVAKAYKLSKLTKTDSIKEEDLNEEPCGDYNKGLTIVDIQTNTAQNSHSSRHLTPKILVDEGSGCSDYYPGDPIKYLRQSPEPKRQQLLTVEGKTPSPAVYRNSVSTCYGTSPYDALRSPPTFPKQIQTSLHRRAAQEAEELDNTTELGSLEVLRGVDDTSQEELQSQKPSPIVCLEQEFKESHDMEGVTSQNSGLFSGFHFHSGHGPERQMESKSYSEGVPANDEVCSNNSGDHFNSRNQKSSLLERLSNSTTSNGHLESAQNRHSKESDALSINSMPSILDDDIFSEAKDIPDNLSDYTGLSRPQSLKLSKRTRSFAGDSVMPPSGRSSSTSNNAQVRRERTSNLRSKWQSSSHFSEQVESPLSDYSGHSVTPERDYHGDETLPTVRSDMMLHDWDRSSETSSDFGGDSYIYRLQRIKDQHEVERGSQMEITMGKLGKVLGEISNAPEKLDDPVFMEKLKKECSKQPSYLEKLQQLKAQHEHKKRICFEREEFTHDPNPYTYVVNEGSEGDGNRRLSYEPEQQNSGRYNYEPEQDTGGFSDEPEQNSGRYNYELEQNTGRFSYEPEQNTGRFSYEPEQNTGKNSYEPEQRTSLFDLLTSSRTADSEPHRDAEEYDQNHEHQTAGFLIGGDDFMAENLTDTDKLLSGGFMDKPYEHLVNSGDLGHLVDRSDLGHLVDRDDLGHLVNRDDLGHLVDRGDLGHLVNRGDLGHLEDRNDLDIGEAADRMQGRDLEEEEIDDSTELKDIVHLKGLTDDVLEILKHSSVPRNVEDNDDDAEEELSQDGGTITTVADLLDFSCTDGTNMPSAIQSDGTLVVDTAVLVDPMLTTNPMQQCDTGEACDNNNSPDSGLKPEAISDDSQMEKSTTVMMPEIVVTTTGTSSCSNTTDGHGNNSAPSQNSTDSSTTTTTTGDDSAPSQNLTDSSTATAAASRPTDQPPADGTDAFKLKEQRRLSLHEKGKDTQSFELEEVQSADIEADPDTVSSDLPTIRQPRGLLLRTGSAQSDSSGFADSVDSHSVAEVTWDGRKVKQHIESGIETSSERTDTTVVTTADSYSRQSSSASSNTVTEITPLPDEDHSYSTSSSVQTTLIRQDHHQGHSGQIFFPQTSPPSFEEDANNNSGEVLSREDSYEYEEQEQREVQGEEGEVPRKKKLTTSRGHPHSKGTGQFHMEQTGPEGDPSELNNLVEEVEFDPQKQSVQEDTSTTTTATAIDHYSSILFPDRPTSTTTTHIHKTSDLEVEEVELDLYGNNTSDRVCSSSDPVHFTVPLNARDEKSTLDIVQRASSHPADDQSDSFPSSPKSHDLRSLMLEEEVLYSSEEKSSRPHANNKSVKFDAVPHDHHHHNKVSDSQSNADQFDAEYRQYEFPKVRLAEKRKDIIQKNKNVGYDSREGTCEEGFAVPYKPDKYEFQDLTPDTVEEGGLSSDKALNNNSDNNYEIQLNQESDDTYSTSSQTKMKLKRHVSAPGQKTKVSKSDSKAEFAADKHVGQFPSDYKQYDFPKVRLGDRRDDIKARLKAEQGLPKDSYSDEEQPVIILTGEEVAVDVDFPEGYDRDRFRAKSKEIVAEAIKSAKEKVKQEEKASSKKKKRFPWSHQNKDKPSKTHLEKESTEALVGNVDDGAKNKGGSDWEKTYIETYALDDWDATTEQAVAAETSPQQHAEPVETQTPPKKSWFSFKSGAKGKDGSSKPAKSPSKVKEDTTSHALRKNADYVFKATLSPFRRIWSVDDHKAESVEEASLKKQMERADNSSDVSSPGSSSINQGGGVAYQDDCSNDVSLADELREYDAPEQDISVIELTILPQVETRPMAISKEQFVSLVGDEEDYDDEMFHDKDKFKGGKPESVCSDDSDTFAIDLDYMKDLDSDDSDAGGPSDEVVSEDEINPTEVQKKLETVEIFNDVPSVKEATTHDKVDAHEKNAATVEAEKELQSLRAFFEADIAPRTATAKYLTEETVVKEESDISRHQSVDSVEQQLTTDVNQLYINDFEEDKVYLDPPEVYLDDQQNHAQEDDNDVSPVATSSLYMQPIESLPDSSVPDENVHKDFPLITFDAEAASDSSSESSDDSVGESLLIPTMMQPSHLLPRQDSILDKFFENPTFESHSESDEDKDKGGKPYTRDYSESSVEDIDITELGAQLYDLDLENGQKLHTSLSLTSDIDNSSASSKDQERSFESTEVRRRSGSDMDDKCVGTELSDLSVLSQDSACGGTVYSKKMVVSKLSIEPQRRTVPVKNDVAELILIIDNGEIKEVKSVESRRAKQEALVGVYESYDVTSSPSSSGGSIIKKSAAEYHSPPYDHVARSHNNRMSRDSGYASNFTSLSDPQYHGDRHHQHHASSLNLKVSQTQQGGSSYIPIIGDGSVRPRVARGIQNPEEQQDDVDGMSVTSNYSDVSEHQVLSTMLKQSEYYGAQIEGILQKSRWPLFTKTRAITKQNLVEEVKLMQHALQKYKMEFKALQLRANNVYREHLDQLTFDEREALENVEEIRTEIINEIVELEKSLAVRMRNIIAGTGMLSDTGPLDLASLHVISQMIEVLKEQVYHSNVVNSMCDPTNSPIHPLMAQLESSSSDHDENTSGIKRSNSLIDHLALLQSQIQAQQSQQAAVLNGHMRELKSVLLDEIRSSIQSETLELKCKLENTETQLHELRQQVSHGGTPHNLSQELILMDFDVIQKDGLADEDTF